MGVISKRPRKNVVPLYPDKITKSKPIFLAELQQGFFKDLKNMIKGMGKERNISIRVDRSEENFPKSILTMVFGWENASG